MRSISSGLLRQVMGKRGQSLAPRQRYEELTKQLAKRVDIDPEGLKGFVERERGEEGEEGKKGKKLEFEYSVYTQVASALNTGKHVILIGPPGTGKTTLAEDICKYATGERAETTAAGLPITENYILSTATADWTTFDTIGGLVPTVGDLLEFRPGLFLKAVCHGHWLIIDEINRAEIDKAFGELFTVLSGQQVTLPHQVGTYDLRILPPEDREKASQSGYDYVIHPNWRIIGTMNVYDKSQLFFLSFAFMRRFAFVDVDLPDEKEIYAGLRSGWLSKIKLEDKKPPHEIDFIERRMTELFKPTSTLMERRALGPAIAEDMIGHIKERYRFHARSETADETAGLQFLAEAFLLYAAPQLDGLDRQSIQSIYQEMKKVFAVPDAEGEEVLRLAQPILTRIRSLYLHMTEDDWEPPEREEG
jgi:MoxR-like ATPase